MKNNHSTYHKGHDSFIAKAQNWIQSAQLDYKPVVTCFLSPIEKEQFQRIVPKNMFITFSGGYDQAQRVVGCISCYEIDPYYDLVILKSKYDNRYKTLTHKDILGALMHSGIERKFLGDLIVEKDSLYIMAKESISSFIQNEITSIGRCSVHFERTDHIGSVIQNYKELTIHVSSLRLDAIVAQLAHTSRSQATLLIKSGLVKVNDVVVEENRQLCNNVFVSIRKVGRFQIMETISQTRKGRLVLRVNQFL